MNVIPCSIKTLNGLCEGVEVGPHFYWKIGGYKSIPIITSWFVIAILLG